MPILSTLVRAHLRSPLRGKTRVTLALARRFPSLQAVAVQVTGRPSVFVDLRDAFTHDLLRDSPLATGPWEPESQAALAAVVRPGDVCWDVGANLGFYVSLLASLGDGAVRVVAVEANPTLIPTLRRTVNAIPGAQLLPVGLAEVDGTATFYVPFDHTMGALTTWGADRLGGGATEHSIALRCLDSIVCKGDAPRPDIIKMDIEGAEPLAFAGGSTILNHVDAPILLFEANRYASPSYGFDSAEGTRRLLGFEHAAYECFAWDGVSKWVPATVDGTYHGNVLAIPRSKRNRWPTS